MSKSKMDPEIIKKAEKWLKGQFDEETKARVRYMIENEPTELVECFYKDLEFGTGGLRGIMGTGSNRMNKYTVGMATQGLSNYLKEMFPEVKPIRVAIAYDSRNNSDHFAKIAAEVFSANGFEVFLFDSLRPTPELSFTIRHLKCQSGVVITASHNPKEYNGYKAYWDDGAQMINPHDVNVIEEVKKIEAIDEVNFAGDDGKIHIIGEDIDRLYLQEIKKQSLSPDIIKKHKDLVIVYTPLHGTGYKLIPEALEMYGFTNVHTVEEQGITDGDFPTVKSPNPEETAAMEMALKKGKQLKADLIMATDPDADRVGIAVKNSKGDFVLLNGNQTAALLIYYMLGKWESNEKLSGKEYIVKTIVTSEILADIARDFKVEYFDVLTGFKFIADKIREYEGKMKYIVGGEESYGYMIGDFVRDKDAVSACAMLAETTAWAVEKGKTLYEVLIEIYLRYGFYKERLLSVVRKGKAGEAKIKQMMEDFRDHPPVEINGSKVIIVKDYLKQIEKDLVNNIEKHIDLPKSNVLQFFTEDGTKISMRPSGTEPKIKFYFSVKEKLDDPEEYEKINEKLEERIDQVIEDLGI
ncbi:MAG: phospho-sugar mutase [Bacteroidales bacterium]|nr:phospho-sugar mutase [Bacteroidales bacterium]MCF8344263.1 phospho-sugar mutase [Bacteroidales bacterium]MCF8349906.1 phospho-sugar mutase [Bacteroidales bacterium]MCF8376787.1 phospho-sugar mutase [Bacteroidales bacterium]MCF8401980.1 phospho-sugar mutase [Bacteroidales bacterium]